MSRNRLAAGSLVTLALFAAPGPARAHDSACFAAAARDAVTLHGPQLQAMSDQLVRTVSSEGGVADETTYRLMRQTLLIERIQRGFEAHAEAPCTTALDRVRRDFEMLRTTWKAFARGDAALGIARLESKPAQDVLADIATAMQPIEKAVAELVVVQAGS